MFTSTPTKLTHSSTVESKDVFSWFCGISCFKSKNKISTYTQFQHKPTNKCELLCLPIKSRNLTLIYICINKYLQYKAHNKHCQERLKVFIVKRWLLSGGSKKMGLYKTKTVIFQHFLTQKEMEIDFCLIVTKLFFQTFTIFYSFLLRDKMINLII